MSTTTYPQRADYMANKVTHEEYYRSVAHEAGISYERAHNLPRILRAVRAGDIHLNTIPLWEWDSIAMQTRRCVEAALKLHGDSWSLAGGVCTHKAAALLAVELTVAV